MIGPGKGVDHGEGHAILGENEGICHKKASEPSAHLTPVKRENISNPQIGISANEALNLGKVVDSGSWAHATSRAKESSINMGEFTIRIST